MKRKYRKQRRFKEVKITKNNAFAMAHYYQAMAKELFVLCRGVDNTHQLTILRFKKMMEYLDSI